MNKDTINKIYIISILFLIFTIPFYLSVPETTRRNITQYDDLILHAIKKDSKKKIKKLYEENEDYQYLPYSTPPLYANPKQDMKLLFNPAMPSIGFKEDAEKHPFANHKFETLNAQASTQFEQQVWHSHIAHRVHRHTHEHNHSSNHMEQTEHQKHIVVQQSKQRMKFIQSFMQEQQMKAFEHFKQIMEQHQKLAYQLSQMRMQSNNEDEIKAVEQTV